jgi:uncharacterized protein
MDEEILLKLDQRFGRLQARQRLGIEADHEAQLFGQGINFFHIENWYYAHSIIRNALKLTGLYWRGPQLAADHPGARARSGAGIPAPVARLLG